MAKHKLALSRWIQRLLAVGLCLGLLAIVAAPIFLNSRRALPLEDFYDPASVSRNLKSRSEEDQAIALINLFYRSSTTMSSSDVDLLLAYICESDPVPARNRTTVIRVCEKARGLMEVRLVHRLLGIERGQGPELCSTNGRRLIAEILIEYDPRYANGIVMDDELQADITLELAVILEVARARGVPIELPAPSQQHGPP